MSHTRIITRVLVPVPHKSTPAGSGMIPRRRFRDRAVGGWVSRILVATTLIVCLVQPNAAADPVLPKDARVVFYGDGLVSPAKFSYMVESFMKLRYPEWGLRFWHIAPHGVGYGNLEVAHAKFDELVAPLKPTVIVLCWGLGDGELKQHDAGRVDATAQSFQSLIGRGQEIGAKVYALTPPPPTIDKKNILSLNRYDVTIERISESLLASGGQAGAEMLDWHGAVVALRKQQPNADWTGTDGLMPSPLSQSVAAHLILQAWQAAAIDVAISLDLATGTVTTSHGQAELTQVDDHAVRLAFQGLPMPWHTGDHASAFREEFASASFCKVMLQATNAPAGPVIIGKGAPRQEPLSIDAATLQTGYNLAWESPLSRMAAHSEFVRRLLEKNTAMTWVLRTMHELQAQPPEPELRQAHESYLYSRVQYVDGMERILLRTPTVLDGAFEIRFAGPLAATKQETSP